MIEDDSGQYIRGYGVAARRSPALRPFVTAVCTALVTASTISVLAAPAAAATTCSDPLTTWTGLGDGSTWTVPGNWDHGVPTALADAAIPAGVVITGVTGSACKLDITGSSGAVALSGNLALTDAGIAVAPGTTLTLLGGTVALPGGAAILRSGTDGLGTVVVGSGATLGIAGVATVGDVDLQLAGGTINGDPTNAPPQLKEQGAGALHWSDGSITGTLQLAGTFLSATVACTGTCTLAPGGTLSTSSQTAFEFESGVIHDEGTIVNGGIMRFLPSTQMTGAGLLRNATVDGLGTVPPTLEFGPQPGVSQTGPVTLTGVRVDNTQTIDIASGTPVTLAGATSTFENGGILSTPGGIQTPASLTIGNGATVKLVGTTKLQTGFVLALNDGSDGSHASIVADPSGATLTGTATSSQPVQGTFTWASGAVTGPLTIGGAVATAVTSPAGAGHVLSGGLTLAGESTIGAATVRLQTNAKMLVTARTTIDAAGADVEPASGATGASVTVAAGGTLRRVPASGNGTAAGETATIGVPVVNNGTVELDASLAANGGYSQTSVANPPTGAPPPLTAVLGGSTLTSSSAIAVTGGGVGGKGNITAPSLNVSNGWIGPGYRKNCHEVDSTFAETCAGTLTVHGALALQSGADVQVVVRSVTAHDTLAVTKAASLAGRLTVATDSKYVPAYAATVAKVMRYASRTGAFTKTSSPIAPVGFGWQPSYDDVADSDGRGVDVQLVDTEAPTIGFAGIPAFTQQNIEQVVYAGSDNKTGVASYDVRWRRYSLVGAAGGWVYPKTWQHTTTKIQTITGVPEGYTYCVQVRARDHAGNVSPWTAAPCSARMVDDRFLRAAGRWDRVKVTARWYDSTVSRTTVHGASLSKYGVFTSVAVNAYRCPTCGTVQIFAGKKLLKTWVLASNKRGKLSWVSPVAKLRTARVWLKVTSRHKLVQIDALGLLH